MTKQSIQQHEFNVFDFTILLLCDIVPITLVLFIALIMHNNIAIQWKLNVYKFC